jgi:hypothetical protein
MNKNTDHIVKGMLSKCKIRFPLEAYPVALTI